MYISPRFRHFAQMVWLACKIDVVVKNYTVAWLHQHLASLKQQQAAVPATAAGDHASSSPSAPSMQSLTMQFDIDSVSFCESTHRMYVHAVPHVCNSLYTHMYRPVLSPQQQHGHDTKHQTAAAGEDCIDRSSPQKSRRK